MKRKLFSRLMAASVATAMTIGLVGCGGDNGNSGENSQKPSDDKDDSQVASNTESEDVGPYGAPLTDENGNVYDLGGMEIIIRNWWSPAEEAEPTNDYEEARKEYRDWIQETYNFTIKEQAISDWGSTPADFTEYATTGGDENYVFVLRDDPAVTNAMAQGLMYDLSTLDCLDFSEAKFTKNKLHMQYSKGGSIYCMYAGDSEPRGGLFFNKRLLTEAGIDPQEIYNLQESGDWTWAKWEEMLEKVQRDIDSDGTIDVYGTTQNAGNLYNEAVWSNGGEYIGMENGKFVYKLDSPETVEALEWSVNKIHKNYGLPYPQDAQWDYYKEAFVNGMAAFMPEDGYAGTPGNFLQDMSDDFGFVCFPKGPKARNNDYTNRWSNNPAAIPACYDAEKAWKIAFAWNLFTEDVPGYEDYEGWKANYYAGMRDTESVDLTAARLVKNGMITYDGIVPEVAVGPDLLWTIGPGSDISAAIEATGERWKTLIDAANNN